MSLERRRGYIRANEQPEGVLERWDIPNYDPSNAPPRDTAMNYDPGWEPAELAEEDQEPELDLSMLTADSLEQIRQSAVEEGMAEGREAGFTEGKEAGFEEGKTEGFEAGKEEGYQQAMDDGQQLIENRCHHLDAILSKLAFPLEQVDHQVQHQVVELVLHLSKAVIQTEVQTNPQVILNTLREAVNALPMNGRQITIYLHPEDLDVVTTAHSVESLRDREWRLIAEPAINRGDIQVACGDSVVDYRMEDRIREMLTRFTGQNMTKEPEPSADGLGADVLQGADKLVTGDIPEQGEDVTVAQQEQDLHPADSSDEPVLDTEPTSEAIHDAEVLTGDDDGQPV
ncbi:flagellar assembly protein FliH [Grimontia sp. NTOU-MAR1]|uniref:flagellar assembly protein FliH n=1 Tax=Grimontia sp. NTOU-MAR1 TaxID=3111011 RepID=UPI002DBF20FE|nr:flagellar assembly protein FliH [Grimontia sp. NTOU-MAR1]WRV97445.1 flagellar assembly protein FliH [Grimontia sp. NTOU-MAR1]